jgi:hypothetical protein
MVVVWVGLPVGITVSHDVDTVSGGFNTSFAVLEVEFAESGKEVFARVPG